MMDDAYEIGIRLVLENGVSSGIAALKDDLAAYDRALMVTTGRLRILSQASAGAGIGGGLVAPASASAAGPAGHSLAGGSETVPPDAEAERRRETPAPATLPAASRPPQTIMTAAPAMPRVSLVGRVAGPLEGALRAPVAPEQPTRAAVEARQGTTPPARAQASIPAAVTMIAVSPPSYARYAPALPAGQPPAVAAPERPQGLDSRPISMPAPDQREIRQAPLAVREPFRPPAWDTVPPNAPTTASGAQVPAWSASAPAAPTVPAAPAAPAASTGPAQGDVFLDGTRVGRWMSDRLARDVDRPQSGVTGFDPRLGPAWPGSLHGT
jgi:hypothetical protein